MPSNSHSIPGFPWIGIRTYRIDHPRDFVPWRARIDDSWKDSLLGYDVAMTDAASLNPDSRDLRPGSRIACSINSKLPPARLTRTIFISEPPLQKFF
jgi:hypothetical protein